MPDPLSYLNFTITDFAVDEYFQNWVLHPDESSDHFWKSLIFSHPGKAKELEDARLLLIQIRFRKDIPSQDVVQMSLSKALEQIREEESIPLRYLKQLRKTWRYAAIVILLILTGITVYILNHANERIHIITRYAELDTIKLPDQSGIVLNANTRLDYNEEFSREVWLNGEAFFNVKHLATGKPFVVHVGRATVTVLGTSFNIRKRRGKVEIALITGSISLHTGNLRQADIIMNPGDLVIADTAFTTLQKTITNTKNSTSWTQKRLVLNNPTVEEIISYLEDIYGKQILLKPAALATRRVEGPILLDSLDDALFVLSTVLNVEIKKDADLLILQQR